MVERTDGLYVVIGGDVDVGLEQADDLQAIDGAAVQHGEVERAAG